MNHTYLLLFFFLFKAIYLFILKTENARVGRGAEEELEGKNHKQTPHRGWNPTLG